MTSSPGTPIGDSRRCASTTWTRRVRDRPAHGDRAPSPRPRRTSTRSSSRSARTCSGGDRGRAGRSPSASDAGSASPPRSRLSELAQRREPSGSAARMPRAWRALEVRHAMARIPARRSEVVLPRLRRSGVREGASSSQLAGSSSTASTSDAEVDEAGDLVDAEPLQLVDRRHARPRRPEEPRRREVALEREIHDRAHLLGRELARSRAPFSGAVCWPPSRTP